VDGFLSAKKLRMSRISLAKNLLPGCAEVGGLASSSTASSLLVFNPGTNSSFVEVETSSNLDATISQITSTFEEFKLTTSTYRSSILTGWAREIRANRSELAELMTLECGKVGLGWAGLERSDRPVAVEIT